MLLEEYGRRYGVKVGAASDHRAGYRAVTPDGLVPGKSLQVKVVGYHMAHHWRKASRTTCRPRCRPRCRWPTMRQAVVIVLLGTCAQISSRKDRDDAAIAAIDRICARFWRRYVVGNDRPDIAQTAMRQTSCAR